MIYLACYLTAAIVIIIYFLIDEYVEGQGKSAIIKKVIFGFSWPLWIIILPVIILYDKLFSSGTGFKK